MGQFVFSYDDVEVPAILEGFKVSYKYQEEIPDPDNDGQMIPNPETLPQFSKRMARKYFRSIHRAGVISLANVDTAKQNAIDDADTRSDGFDVA